MKPEVRAVGEPFDHLRSMKKGRKRRVLAFSGKGDRLRIVRVRPMAPVREASLLR